MPPVNERKWGRVNEWMRQGTTKYKRESEMRKREKEKDHSLSLVFDFMTKTHIKEASELRKWEWESENEWRKTRSASSDPSIIHSTLFRSPYTSTFARLNTRRSTCCVLVCLHVSSSTYDSSSNCNRNNCADRSIHSLLFFLKQPWIWIVPVSVCLFLSFPPAMVHTCLHPVSPLMTACCAACISRKWWWMWKDRQTIRSTDHSSEWWMNEAASAKKMKRQMTEVTVERQSERERDSRVKSLSLFLHFLS